jgi:hypothetical protein
MSFKNASVVMLSTNQKALIGDFVIGTTIEENPKKLFYGKKVQEPFNCSHTNFHLYVISDDDIKVNDWYIIEFNRLKLTQCTSDEELISLEGRDDCKKVIATTDKFLTYTNTEDIPSIVEKSELNILPQPSKSFIEKYVRAYNSGVPIEKVLVEYNHLVSTFGFNYEWLKVATDNTITIKKIKDAYTQQEVDDLLDRNTAQTTAQVLEKFRGFKSKEEVKQLIIDAVIESLHRSEQTDAITSDEIVEGGFLDNWIEEHLK